MFKLAKTNYTLYKDLRPCTSFMECMINERVFISLVTLSKK